MRCFGTWFVALLIAVFPVIPALVPTAHAADVPFVTTFGVSQGGALLPGGSLSSAQTVSVGWVAPIAPPPAGTRYEYEVSLDAGREVLVPKTTSLTGSFPAEKVSNGATVRIDTYEVNILTGQSRDTKNLSTAPKLKFVKEVIGTSFCTPGTAIGAPPNPRSLTVTPSTGVTKDTEITVSWTFSWLGVCSGEGNVDFPVFLDGAAALTTQAQLNVKGKLALTKDAHQLVVHARSGSTLSSSATKSYIEFKKQADGTYSATAGSGGSGSGIAAPFEQKLEKTFSELYSKYKDSVLTQSKASGEDGDRMRDWWYADDIWDVTHLVFFAFTYPGDPDRYMHNSNEVGGRDHVKEVGPFEFYLEKVDGKSNGYPLIDSRDDKELDQRWRSSLRLVYDTTHRHVEHLEYRNGPVVEKVNELLKITSVETFKERLEELREHVDEQLIPQTIVTWSASMTSYRYVQDPAMVDYVPLQSEVARYKSGGNPLDVSGSNSQRLKKLIWNPSGKQLTRGDDTKVYKKIEDYWVDMSAIANIAFQDAPTTEEEMKDFQDRMGATLAQVSGSGTTANVNEGDLRCGKTGGLNPVVYIKAAFCGLVANLQDIAKFFVIDGVNFVLVGAGIPSGIQSGGILSSTIQSIPLYSAPVEDIVRSQQLGGLVRTIHGQLLGLMNAFVIVVLIGLALLTITQVQVSTYSIKRYLPAVVISVVLANVSFFATVALFEVSGAMSHAFFDKERVASVESPPGSTASQVTVYQTTFTDFAFGPGGEYLKMAGDNGEADMGKVFRGGLFAGVLFVAALLLLWLGILFMLRPLILVVMAATSGLAFFGAGFPLLNFIWKRWSKLTFNWAFMPVVALFWIWLGAQFFGVTQQNAGGQLGVVGDLLSFAAGIYCIWLAVKTPFSMAGEAKALVDKVDKGIRGTTKGVTGAGLALGRGATQAALGSERYQATRDRFLQSRAAALGGGLTRQGRINSYEAQKKRLEEQLAKETDPAKIKKIQGQLDRMKKQYEGAVKKKATDTVGAGFFSKDYNKNAELNAAAIDKLDISDEEKKVLKEKQAKNAKLAGNIQTVLPGGVLGIPKSLTQAFYAGQAAFDEQAKYFKGGGERRKQAALNATTGIAGVANKGRKVLEAREEVEKEVIQSAGKVLSEILDGMKADLRAGRLNEVLHNEAAKIRINDKTADKERALETARATFYEGEAAIATALGTKSLLDIETVAGAKREKAEKDLKKKKGAITSAAAADINTLYTALDEIKDSKTGDFTEAERLMKNLKNAGQRRQLEQIIARAKTSHKAVRDQVAAEVAAGTVAAADQDAEIEKRWKDKKSQTGFEALSKTVKTELYGDTDISDAVQKKYTKDRAKELKEIKETIADGDHLGVFGFKGEAKDAMKIVNTLSRDNEHLVDGDVSKKLIALRDQVSRGKVYGESAEAVNGDLSKLITFATAEATDTKYTAEERASITRVATELAEMQTSLVQPLTLMTREQDAKQFAAAVNVDKNLANISFEETIVTKPETVYSTPKKAIEKEQKVVESRQKLITAQRVDTMQKALAKPDVQKQMEAAYRKAGISGFTPADVVFDPDTAAYSIPKLYAAAAGSDVWDSVAATLAKSFAGGGGKKGKGGGAGQLKIRPHEGATAFAAQFASIPEMQMK